MTETGENSLSVMNGGGFLPTGGDFEMSPQIKNSEQVPPEQRPRTTVK